MYQDWNIKIDKKNSRYKKLYRVLGIPMSDGWQKLPDVQYVAITKVKMTKTNRSSQTIGNEASHGIERFVVYLFGSKKNIRVEVCKVKSLKQAKKVGRDMGNYLQKELIDYT